MKYGWKPKEDWEGNPDEWVPAKVFNQRGELFGEIKSLKRRMQEQDQAFKQMQKMLERASETEYNRAINDLKQQKKEALDNADSDAVLQIDDQIEQLKDQRRESATETKSASPDPAFAEWKASNDWYGNDEDMSQFADDIGFAYAQRTGKPVGEVLEYVTKQVKKAFSEKFSNQNRPQESKVEGAGSSGSKRTSKKGKITVNDLASEDRKIVEALKRSGAIKDEQEWIDENVRKGYLTV
jgi:hypothetical protein